MGACVRLGLWGWRWREVDRLKKYIGSKMARTWTELHWGGRGKKREQLWGTQVPGLQPQRIEGHGSVLRHFAFGAPKRTKS